MQPAVAIPAVALLVLRAWSNNSLTPLGICFATVTAAIHALHPWPVFFTLLVVFFLGGTATTKVKHHEKSKITHSSTGDAGGEGPRNHIQVLANSAVSSVLILLHYWQLRQRAEANKSSNELECWAWGSKSDLLVAGIIAQYAAAAADTWASELGILSKSPPRLITSLTLRVVPPGTNGGVTLVGTIAGLAGSLTIALTALLLLPFCQPSEPKVAGVKINYGTNPPGLHGGNGWGFPEYFLFITAIVLWGGMGSLLDSVLGATLQSTVVDSKSGRVIEGRNGRKVLVESPTKEMAAKKEPSRKVVTGSGILDNNGVNFLTSLTMATTAIIALSFFWEVPILQL